MIKSKFNRLKLKKDNIKSVNLKSVNLKDVNWKKVSRIGILFVCCYILGACIAILRNAYANGRIQEEVDNWGLGFHTEGQPPNGNATVDELKKYDAYYLGDTKKKVIYLTFDAGYENGYTSMILDALKKHEVPATFFLVGNYLSTAPDLVKRMIDEGHMVGNHTNHHPNMASISSKESFEKELCSLEDMYRDITGLEMPKYYRPPQGKYSMENLKMAQELGYKTFFWSLAYVDWYNDKQPSHQEAFKKLTGRIHPGAIVLLHSTSKTNGEIMDELITRWKEMGYTFGSLEDF